ncbi:MAG: HAD-IIIC family phosphatase [Ignavibacteria bacterium]|nr:HAD-IIIC family phosphatase [Ignavibacteria bacterium]
MSSTARKIVLRNFTVEHLFDSSIYDFSGYDDISTSIENYSQVVWFYFVPINFNVNRIWELMKNYLEKIEFIKKEKRIEHELILFTLSSRFPRIIFENSNHEYDKAVSYFNKQIYDLANYDRSIKTINLDDFIIKYRKDELIDWKFFYLSQMLPSPMLANEFKKWFKLKINAINQVRKKCIILDLDNTLWGGILGENGIEGIKLGGGYPGNVFKEFQLLLKEAEKNGIILSIASKNNENDVLEAWGKHPEMVLKKENFVNYRINWEDKAENIINIAKELNIGLDSIIFFDDNPRERERVKSALPDVVVPEFPNEPYLLIDFFSKIYSKYFQTYKLTKEDKSKIDQYKANTKRKRFQSKVSSVDEFIRQLEIELIFYINKKENIQRIAQLTQKINQFNLTTRRHSESEIQQYINNDHIVFSLSVKDKFGDSGITAAAIIKLYKDQNRAEIDSFLLSCRILGKGIENTFLQLILNNLYSKNLINIFSAYVPTKKNNQTKDFYERNGFSIRDGLEDGSKTYSVFLKQELSVNKNYKVELGT